MKSRELINQIFEKQERLDEIVKELEALRIQRQQLQDERLRLIGNDRYGGEIRRLKKQYQAELIREHDAKAPKPVFIKTGASPEKYLISRITEDKIYLRHEGSTLESWYDKETGKEFGWDEDYASIIDVEATVSNFHSKPDYKAIKVW